MEFGLDLVNKLFNGRGFYDVRAPDTQPGTIQLLVNKTEGINETKIKCLDELSFKTLSQTTLIIYGKCMTFIYLKLL